MRASEGPSLFTEAHVNCGVDFSDPDHEDDTEKGGEERAESLARRRIVTSIYPHAVPPPVKTP